MYYFTIRMNDTSNSRLSALGQIAEKNCSANAPQGCFILLENLVLDALGFR